jgi:hypothetical protein
MHEVCPPHSLAHGAERGAAIRGKDERQEVRGDEGENQRSEPNVTIAPFVK